MSRYFIICILLTTFCYSCSDKTMAVNQPSTFKSFEISYTNGWTKGFSLIVDTNKIYLSPYNIDTTYYGILPDTIFTSIDTFALTLLSETSIKSTKDICHDCDVVAIQVVSKNDTTNIYQAGTIDSQIWNIISSLQKFIDIGRHQKIHAITFLQTRNLVVPLPPKIENTSIEHPIKRKKSGR